MKVYLSDDAREYLRQEAAYLRKHSPAAAESFLARMRNVRQIIGTFPLSGEALPVPGVRRLVMGDYLLDYEVSGRAAEILSIRHGRQQPAPPQIDPDFNYEARIGAETEDDA